MENIREYNKLIGEFMCKPDYIPVEQFKYHSSWDWLIPVVEKIELTNRLNDKEYYPYMVTIWKNCCSVTDGNNGNEIVRAYAETKREAVYKTVVAFIEFYNTYS